MGNDHRPMPGDPGKCVCGTSYAVEDIECGYCGQPATGETGDGTAVCDACAADVDRTALDRIAGMLAGEWSPDTLTEIDATVRATGRNPGGE